MREVLEAVATWSGGADKDAEQGQGCTQAGRGGDAIETRAPGWVEWRETESAGGGEQGRPSLRQGRQRRCPGICLCPDRRLPVVFINAAPLRLFRWNVEIDLTVPQQQWPGLLEFLHQACMADSPEHREVGLLLFAALFETIGACAPTQAATICG